MESAASGVRTANATKPQRIRSRGLEIRMNVVDARYGAGSREADRDAATTGMRTGDRRGMKRRSWRSGKQNTNRAGVAVPASTSRFASVETTECTPTRLMRETKTAVIELES